MEDEFKEIDITIHKDMNYSEYEILYDNGKITRFFHSKKNIEKSLIGGYGKLLICLSNEVRLNVNLTNGEISPQTLESLCKMTELYNHLSKEIKKLRRESEEIKDLRKDLEKIYSRERYSRNTLRKIQ